ncbi:MAG: hypothetical protein U5N27_05465 [Rhizobium sp.]|nr:hypothetical protein [Rhizobium sp.]
MWLELHDGDGFPFYVNMDNVVDFRWYEREGYTCLLTTAPGRRKAASPLCPRKRPGNHGHASGRTGPAHTRTLRRLTGQHAGACQSVRFVTAA